MIIVMEMHFGSKKLPFSLVVVLLFVTGSICNFNTYDVTSEGMPSNAIPAFFGADIDMEGLPSTEVQLTIEGLPSGSSITGTLDFGFGGWEGEDVVGIGYSESSIVTDHSDLYIDIVGIGCEMMREYVFAYTSEGVLFDDLQSGIPSGESPRNSWPWDAENYVSTYTERFNETMLAELTSVGFVIEYEDLTAHYEDGSSVICGPSYVTVGVNFTRSEDTWNVERIITSSSADGVEIDSGSITLSLSEYPAIRPQTTLLLIAVPTTIGLLVVGAIWWKRKNV